MSYTWASSGYFCEYLLGNSMGFFKREGLSVSFQQGTGSSTSIQLIASGKYDFGGAIATSALISAVSAGAPVKMVAADLPSVPLAVISTAAHPISTPQQLVGKTIGIAPGTEQAQLWPAFLKVNHLSPNSVKVASISATALPAELARGGIAGYVSYSTDEPYLRKIGVNPRVMYLAQYGVSDSPGEGVVTNDSMLKEHPTVVRKFLAALRDAFNYMLKHPSAAASAGVKYYPNDFTMPEALQTLAITNPLIKQQIKGGDVTKLFEMSPAQFQSTVNLLKTYAGLQNPAQVSNYFTNAFIPAASS